MLKRRYRLVKRGSFNYVYRNGGKVSTAPIQLRFVRSKGLKIGFSVGAKVGGAVKRNLVKRRMRHAAASLLGEIDSGFQIVFVCLPPVAQLSYHEIFLTMRLLLKKAAILPN